jgi:glutathione S-transferase
MLRRMKLLSSPLSPFAARVRLAIHAGSLPVEVAPSNMWTATGQKSPEYLALNPIGKVPTLILADGSALPESDTIVEYLADAFPQARLRPERAEDVARARLLARIVELYVVGSAWGPLFGQLFAAARDEAAVDGAVAQIAAGTAHLEHFMTGDAYAVGDRISTADCAIVPFLTFQGRLLRFFGREDPARSRPRTAAYLDRVGEDAAVQRVLTEMREGLIGSRLEMLLAEA